MSCLRQTRSANLGIVSAVPGATGQRGLATAAAATAAAVAAAAGAAAAAAVAAAAAAAGPDLQRHQRAEQCDSGLVRSSVPGWSEPRCSNLPNAQLPVEVR